MPTKRLPESANIDHLKNQAKDLLRDFRSGQMSAFQRIREFHPHHAARSDEDLSQQTYSLSDALLSIAREYGYPSWPRLKAVVAEAQGDSLELIHNERIEDAIFRQALDFVDEGNEDALRQHLSLHPDLVHQEVIFEGGNYFSDPTLLEFVAENPIRQGKLAPNIVAIAKIILDAGAKENQTALDETLMLTSSGRLVREHGVQLPLLDLLCEYGADPQTGMPSALAHGEFEAAHKLIEHGTQLDLTAAAALNLETEVVALLANASKEQKQLALALSALHNRHGVVATLLTAGADPNRYNPPGGHSHCTPLHSAVWEGHLETVKVLVENGARFDIGDIHHNANARDWAKYAGHENIVRYFDSL